MAHKMVMISAIAATLTAVIVPATAMAQDHYDRGDEGYSRQGNRGRWNDRQDYDRQGYDRNDRGYGRKDQRYAENDGYNDNRYQGDYRHENRQVYYGGAGFGRPNYGRVNYGRPTYRYRCEGSGTTGTIIGAIAGGLIGNGVAGRGDRTLGLLLGGGAGALAGRAIDRSSNHC